ncbi:MAG: hypothetical protein FWF08_09990, partial [Oscillospiraceae bacterium]|nr:hypothetical protein [Oscillospiraceae bacterium]
MNLKLQNILFPDSGYLDDNWWMFYRDSRMFYDDMDGSYNLDKHKTYDFFTYFNSFSLKKWKTYTALTNVTLNLRMQGRFRIRTFGHSRNGSIEKEHNDPMSFDLKEAADIRILFPEMKSTVISFVIDTMDEVKLYGGYYSTEVPDSCINRVDISLVTTTFKKEDYIKNNVKILNKRIFSGHEDLKNHLEVKVIDNG